MPELVDRLQHSLGPAYTVQRELTGGGMARVFVARDQVLGRDVVVKVLAPELAEGLSAGRFAREIRVAAQLQEPHIVPVHAAATTADGLPYYTMPYVAGQSLRARLSAGPLPLAEAIAILRDVATALEYAHAQGVVHRDIKPENVLLSGRTAVVTDFGIAKALSASRTRESAAAGTLTRAGTALGTPAYMAPEQAAGDPDVDARADLYAWGVLAYELLAGRHPFASKATAPQLIAAQISETPLPLREVAPRVPSALAALVMRCLAKDPAGRPSSAAELLAALDAGGAARVTPERAPRARVVAAAGGVALLLAAGGLAWHSHRRAAVADAASPLMLAVLPFEHEGPGERAYFASGLTDALTGKLGAVSGLAVIDRGSAAHYRRTTKPARQIGRELGVPYLVQGVVRWAQDATGTWRAQVTPTLVDARTGTTRWTGEPVVVTPADPFTAQAQIATDVARTLQVQLRPADRAGLARRMTENPAAYDAYLRGRAHLDAEAASSTASLDAERAVTRLEQAVALDSTFAEAWRWLGFAYGRRGLRSAAGEAIWYERAQSAWRRAAALAPDAPAGLLARVDERQMAGDTAGALEAAARAYAVMPNDPEVIRRYATIRLWRRGSRDSARALLARAVQLDPRSLATLQAASRVAAQSRRWDEAARYADAMIALDSTDQRGWVSRLRVAVAQGDTVTAQRTLARALARLGRPSRLFLPWMARVGGDFGQRLVALSADEAGAVRWSDSAFMYYGNKGEVFLRRGDLARARIYYDSVRRVVRPRLHGIDREQEPLARVQLAAAEAILGDTAEARRELARALAPARALGRLNAGSPYAPMVAAVHAWLAEPDTAVRWLEVAVGHPDAYVTARELALWPTLRPLWGTPAFTRFLRQHPR